MCLWMTLYTEVLYAYTHSKGSHTLVKDPVVHVDFATTTKQNNPAYTERPDEHMWLCISLTFSTAHVCCVAGELCAQNVC